MDKVTEVDKTESTSATQSSTIFVKRKGTTDRGKDYEHFYIAYLALKLILDESIENFLLSSNDSQYGAFDDVVVETFSKNQTEIYAFQLKHVANNNKNISGVHLSASDGNFSLAKYLLDYQKNLKKLNKPIKMVLFTNSHFSTKKKILLNLNQEEIQVNAEEIDPIKTFNTSRNGLGYSLESTHYNDFFNNFLLYTDQSNFEEIEKSIRDVLRDNFTDQDIVFKEYVNFVVNWSMIEGKKEKLDKSFLKSLIILHSLSPLMKTLSFSGDREIPNNGKTFKDAVSKFHVTILKEKKHETIRNLWRDEIETVDVNEVNKVNAKFKIVPNTISCKEDFITQGDKKTNQLLWLIGRCPLIIKMSFVNYNILRMDKKKNFVLLKTTQNTNGKEFEKVFQNLSDLEKEKSIYNKVLETFLCSVEGQKGTPLKNLIHLDENLKGMFTADELVQMIEEPLQIGKNKETLPPCHISRSLSKVVVDTKFLHKAENNLFVISGIKDESAFKKRFKNMKVQQDGTFKLNSNEIYISTKEVNQEKFDEHVEKTKMTNCHHFKYLNQDCLEWVRSKNSITQLTDFRIDHKYVYWSPESEAFDGSENTVNVICANPGMGKSTLAKSLKNDSDSSVWTIIIYSRNNTSYYEEVTEDKVNTFFNKFIEDSYENDLDKRILQLLIKNNKIRLIWDGLDEVTDKSLDMLLNVIKMLGRNGYKQWITSRRNLMEKLEDKLGVFSKAIKEFDKNQQKEYIKERLGLSEEELPDVFKKIENRVLFLNNDILGIPLQIYMLTELLCRVDERQKFLDEETDYTTLTLYEKFVHQKFVIHKKEKENYDFKVHSNVVKFDEEKTKRIELYKQVAFDFYFKETLKTFTSLICCSNNTVENEFLDKTAKEGDPIGFISRVNDENEPEFSHNSYGEYFAALHVVDKVIEKVKSKNFISNSRYNNIRLFVDLKLSGASKSHISVLYRNYKLLVPCQGNMKEVDLDKLDSIKRKPLELSCAWSKKYPFLENAKNLVKPIDDEILPSLDHKPIVNSWEKIKGNLHVCEQNLILLLPFLIPFYNMGYKRFDDDYIFTIIFYAIKFDYAFIFTCSAKIPWLDNIHTKCEPKTLVSLIVTYNSKKCLQELIEKKDYGEVLLRNFDVFQNSSSFKLHEYFSLLVNSVNSSLQSTLRGKTNVAMETLIKKCVQVNAPDENGKMLIHYACESGDTKTVKLLIQENATVDDADNNGRRAIHYACEKGVYDIVKLLVDAEAEVGSTDNDGCTPLHYACQKGNRYIVQLLLEKGAKVDVVDKKGRTPLHYTSFNNNHYFTEIVKMLTTKQT